MGKEKGRGRSKDRGDGGREDGDLERKGWHAKENLSDESEKFLEKEAEWEAASCMLWLKVTPCIALVNAQNQKAIFILAGQSSMAGRGGITYEKPPTPENPLGGVWDNNIPPDSHSNPHILHLIVGGLSAMHAKRKRKSTVADFILKDSGS
nr:probable carbohydrate esterase At4g34215 [Ipomoea batatas]